MNKIEHEEEQKKLDEIHIKEQILLKNTRRFFLSSALAAAGLLVLNEAHTEKGNGMKVINLNQGYTNHKANFDELFVYAYQNRTVPWSMKDGGQKDLDIPTGKGNEKYILSLKGDQMRLILSSYEYEYIWRYNVNTSFLELKGNINFTAALEHFGKVQQLIKKQYPNF